MAGQGADGGPAMTIYRPGIILERRPSQNSMNTFGPFIFLDGIFRILLAIHRRQGREEVVRVRGWVDGSLPFIFDDDVVEAILRIAGSSGIHGRTFHLVSSCPCPNRMVEEVFNARITSYNVCYTKLLRSNLYAPVRCSTKLSILPGTTVNREFSSSMPPTVTTRITSYNVCYTKLLRGVW